MQNAVVLPSQVPRALYPFDSHVLMRGDLRYHYLDEGQGDPVVMLHGNPSWSFYYRGLVQALCDRHRTIVPDHIGMGLSDKPGVNQYDYQLASRVNDLEALLAHLGLDMGPKITLVMHDWGGMIGMTYASRHPDRIARLVLMNTAAFHLPADMRLPLALRLVRAGPLGAMAVQGFNAFSRAAAHVGTKRTKMSAALRNAYCAPYDTWCNRIGTYRFVKDIPLAPADPSYDVVSGTEASLPLFRNTPAMFAWGMQDFVFTPQVLKRWQALWPQAAVHTFDDCGHYVLEDATAQVCTLVRDFLKQHPLEAAETGA